MAVRSAKKINRPVLENPGIPAKSRRWAIFRETTICCVGGVIKNCAASKGYCDE
jgi:hypothetical protein